MVLKKLISRHSVNFRSEDDGMISAMGLFAIMFAATVGAIALDVTHLITARTHLQAAADQAAHTAIFRRNNAYSPKSENQAKQDALDLVASLIPASIYGDAITTADINFGTFNEDTRVFTASAGATEAVQVNSIFTAERGNSARSYLFNFIGIENFDIVTSATFVAFSACERQGFHAKNIVDIQSNNAFGAGFCMFGGNHVELNNHNSFELGAKVSMPNKGDLVIPSGGMESNPGLAEALTSGFRDLRILDDLELMRDGFLNNDEEYVPDYITNPIPINLNTRRIRDGDLVPGNIYNVSCSGRRVQFSTSQPIEGVVIVTDCEVRFSQGAELNDAIILTTNTDAGSFSSPSNLKVGRNDDCAPGGGATLITHGGMNFPSSLESHEGNFIARGSINFSANAAGIKGVNMVSGEDISGTSNMAMGLCPADVMGDLANKLYFRLVL